MAVEWWVKTKEKEFGPYTSTQLKQYVVQGQVKPESVIRRGATGTWVKASQVRGLFPDAPAAPTPSPVAEPLPTSVENASDDFFAQLNSGTSNSVPPLRSASSDEMPPVAQSKSKKTNAAVRGEKPSHPLAEIAFGVGGFIIGIVLFRVFSNLEAEGGSVRMNVIILLIYDILGKWGVLAVCWLGGVALLGSGIRRLIKRKKATDKSAQL